MIDYPFLKATAGYISDSIPNSVDIQIRDLLQSVDSEEGFAQMRTQIPRDSWNVLRLFAERAASLAVREESRLDVRVGLVAAEFALAYTDDFRDVLPAVSLLYRAAELIGIDPVLEFNSVALLTGDPAGSHVMKYLRRSPENRTIERMGFIEGVDGSGFRFQYNR